MWASWFYIIEWAIRLVMAPLVMRRKRSTVGMAWLLVIFFEPLIGLAVYLLVGENHLPRRRIKRHRRALEHVQTTFCYTVQQPHVIHPQLDADQMPLVMLAEKLGEMPIVGGNEVEIFITAEETISRLIADIDSAEHHVHLLFYIFEDDATGRKVAEALARAAGRGVKCRLLADHVGSIRMFASLEEWMIERGVQVEPALSVNPFRRFLSRIDLRNHRKIAVIDGAVGYSGSQNIVDPTYGTRKLVWHDMTVRLTGPVVAQLQLVFVEDWHFDTDHLLDSPDLYPMPVVAGNVAAQGLPSGPTYDIDNYQRFVLAAIHAAKRHIIITTPYFVPDEPLLEALQIAALRGVTIELIVPRESDQLLSTAAARAYYSDLLKMGVIIHLHHEGLLHSKTITIDDAVALIGSANFDIRSFRLNFEFSMLFYGPHVTAQLRHAQRCYIAQSDPLKLIAWNHRPRWRQLIDDTASLLSPLL